VGLSEAQVAHLWIVTFVKVTWRKTKSYSPRGIHKMARMHSRDKGKSGSTKPIKKVPSWAPYKEKEVGKLVTKYAKEEKSTSEIGMILRDRYGINSVKAITGKKIGAIMQEQGLAQNLPEDLLNLIRKMVLVKQHIEKNKQDMTALRGFQLTNSKVRRLVKYYQKTNRLPSDWKLDMNKLKMYIG
jgi:small subunit ribosomal protein S15